MIFMSTNNFLIQKYDKKRMPYEDRGREYDKLRKREQRKNELQDICDDLFYECKLLGLTNYQKQRVIYLVEMFGDNFKSLHGQAKKETIILAFIFYIKKIEDPRIRLERYQITSKYDLTDNIFEIIVCRLCEFFMKRMPIVPYGTTKYNHEFLSRNGGEK